MNIKLNAVRKAFGGRSILDGLSGTFPAGQISTVLGLSGCGKTTLLRLIAGLEQTDAGEILFGNESVLDLRPQDRQLGYVFQDQSVYGHLTVERNLLLPLRAQGVRRSHARMRIAETLRHFDLEKLLHHTANRMSGGESQRLALAKSLIREPLIMLLDEPFTQLDSSVQREARRLVFAELRKRQTTTVLVTHNPVDAQEACGEVFFLEQGRFVQIAPWSELFSRPATPTVAKVVSFIEPLQVHGKLTGSDGDWMLDEPTFGLSLPIRPDLATWRAVAPGQPAVLFLRPELLTATAQPHGNSTTAGRLVHRYQLGGYWYVVIEHQSGARLEARLPEGQEARIGANAFLDLAPEAQVLLWPNVAGSAPG